MDKEVNIDVEQAEKRLPAISEAERQLRQEAANYATASVELEGFKIDAAEERHTQRFINGDMDLAEFVRG